MINQVAIIVTIAAILISIPVTFSALAHAQSHFKEPPAIIVANRPLPGLPIVNPSGLNTTSTPNMTGAAGNTTGANTTAHGSEIPTTHPAGRYTGPKL